MNTITVVDARMGRGKSSAAIRYMNRYKDSKRFLYITPYLDEVGRICERCDFDQPDSDHMSKSTELKLHMRLRHTLTVLLNGHRSLGARSPKALLAHRR